MSCGCQREKPVCAIGKLLYEEAQVAYQHYVDAIVRGFLTNEADEKYIQAYTAWEEHRRKESMITTCGCTQEKASCEEGKRLQAHADASQAVYMRSVDAGEASELLYQQWLDAAREYQEHLVEYSLRRRAKLHLNVDLEIDLPVIDATEEATAEMAQIVTQFVSRSLEEGKNEGESKQCAYSLSTSWIEE